jgi:hypothetical protein
MTIKDIYQKFGIPPNLQEHMMRVCGIIIFIKNHWKSDIQVDWNLAREIALLHDLGNVVKFDLDKHPEFLGKEQSNINYWKKMQVEVVSKYGSDDHEATKKMLEEIDIDRQAIGIILNKSFGHSVETKNSDNWILKILYYADLRTLPFGVGSLEERIADVKNRMPKYTARPDFDDLVSACRDIENQLQQKINVAVSGINDESTKFDTDALLNTA